jgi:hypothetical protein
VAVHPHRFRHHFSHTWLDRGGPEGDLMEFNGWASPQMLARYGASARSARARRRGRWLSAVPIGGGQGQDRTVDLPLFRRLIVLRPHRLNNS